MKSRKQTTRQRIRQWQKKNETKFAKTLIFHQFNRSTIENFRIHLSNISSNRRREFCFSKRNSTKLKKSRWWFWWTEKFQQSCFWTSFFLSVISSMMKYEMFDWFVERKNRFYVCQTVQILRIESDKSFLLIVFCKSSRSCAIVCFRFHAFIAKFIASWRCDFFIDRERASMQIKTNICREIYDENARRANVNFFFLQSIATSMRKSIIVFTRHTSTCQIHHHFNRSHSFRFFHRERFFANWFLARYIDRNNEFIILIEKFE